MRFFSAVTSLALLGSAVALPTSELANIEKRQSTTPGLVAYWGQPGPSITRLTPICDDPAYTHVVLAFVTDFFGAGGWPKMNLGGYTASQAQINAGATDLIDANNLPGAIGRCRANGKKVLLSIGGATGTTNLTAERYAKAAATNIFNLFLGGSNSTTSPIRPFYDTVLDGIDLDMENRQPRFLDVFVKELRAKMNADTKRSYIITAAPQCPRNLNAPGTPAGDQSLPDAVLKLVDHVWVQFYNNAQNLCNHKLQNFQTSLKDWSAAVSPAKVWVGALARNWTDQTGYISPADIASEIKAVKALKLANFGGYMLWNSEAALQNNNYQTGVRSALNS